LRIIQSFARSGWRHGLSVLSLAVVSFVVAGLSSVSETHAAEPTPAGTAVSTKSPATPFAPGSAAPTTTSANGGQPTGTASTETVPAAVAVNTSVTPQPSTPPARLVDPEVAQLCTTAQDAGVDWRRIGKPKTSRLDTRMCDLLIAQATGTIDATARRYGLRLENGQVELRVHAARQQSNQVAAALQYRGGRVKSELPASDVVSGSIPVAAIAALLHDSNILRQRFRHRHGPRSRTQNFAQSMHKIGSLRHSTVPP